MSTVAVVVFYTCACKLYDERYGREKKVAATTALDQILCSLHTIMYLSVPLDEKVPEGAQPRFWEEEGFYVGEPPQVSPANLNIMENRINDGNQVLLITPTRCILGPDFKD